VNQPAAGTQEPGIGVDRDLDRPVLIPFLGRVGEVFSSILDPFDRAPEQLGGRHHRDVFGVHAKLGTEAAADIGSRHP